MLVARQEVMHATQPGLRDSLGWTDRALVYVTSVSLKVSQSRIFIHFYSFPVFKAGHRYIKLALIVSWREAARCRQCQLSHWEAVIGFRPIPSARPNGNAAVPKILRSAGGVQTQRQQQGGAFLLCLFFLFF